MIILSGAILYAFIWWFVGLLSTLAVYGIMFLIKRVCSEEISWPITVTGDDIMFTAKISCFGLFVMVVAICALKWLICNIILAAFILVGGVTSKITSKPVAVLSKYHKNLMRRYKAFLVKDIITINKKK